MQPHLCQSICAALLRLPLKHLICVAVFMLQNGLQSIFAAKFMLPSCCCIFCNLPQFLCSSICHSSHVTALVQPLSSSSASSVQLSVAPLALQCLCHWQHLFKRSTFMQPTHWCLRIHTAALMTKLQCCKTYKVALQQPSLYCCSHAAASMLQC